MSIGEETKATTTQAMTSPWSPFQSTAFTVLWTATVVANIGSWMYSAASGWLMTSLNPSPLLVSLVQAVTTLPMFLFALPAGALADIQPPQTRLERALEAQVVIQKVTFAIRQTAARCLYGTTRVGLACAF